MSIVMALVVMSAQPVIAAPRESEIIVIGQRLRDWRGRFRTSEGQFYCSTTRSTGDAEIDGIGCTTASTCYHKHQPQVIAAFNGSTPRSIRKAARRAIEQQLTACHRAERERLIDALVERRSQ